MAVDEKAAPLSIRDVVVAVPIVASMLAIIWEIGYFVRIRGGAFGFFSVPEHLNFALQALPFALIITTLALTALVRDRILEIIPVRSRVMKLVKIRFQKNFGILILTTMAFTALMLVYLSPPVSLTAAILVFAIGGPSLWLRYVPIEVSKNLLVQSMVALGVFLCAMFVGFETARDQVRSRLPLNVIKIGEKGKEAETEVKVRIMRTGERGVLYYDPGTQSFALIPWEVVKRIEWSISPLMYR